MTIWLENHHVLTLSLYLHFLFLFHFVIFYYYYYSACGCYITHRTDHHHQPHYKHSIVFLLLLLLYSKIEWEKRRIFQSSSTSITSFCMFCMAVIFVVDKVLSFLHLHFWNKFWTNDNCFLDIFTTITVITAIL